MSANSSSYAYYSFPPTPKRASPATSYRSSNSPPPKFNTPRTSKSMAPSPAAGKGSDTLRTPTKLGRKAASSATSKLSGQDKPDIPETPDAPSVEEATEKVPEQAQEATDSAGKTAEDTTGKVSQAGDDAKEGLAEADPKPIDDVEDTVEGAQEDVKDSVEETTDDATEKAGDLGEDNETDQQEGQEDDEEQGGSNLLSGAKGLAGQASNLAGRSADEVADDVKGTIEGATGQELPDVPGLELLKGLTPDEEGNIKDKNGDIIGRLAEGDAEDLVGYEIGDDGEILDDDGDLVGRCELLPEKIQALKDEAADSTPKLPDVSILKGLSVDAAGQVLNDDGDTIGQLVEGDPSEVKGKPINEKGEILDDDGNVIGRVEIHPDAAEIFDQAEDAVDGVQEGAEDVAGQAEDAIPADIEAELPGVEALEGKEINSEGEILDEDGEVIGKLAEGNLEDVKGLTVNEKGEVVDADGNVLGKVELAEGAAEKLADLSALLDVRILEGLKVNKKGKVLDEEGEEIGHLTEGEAADVAGKLINDKGEVLDKSGNVIGKVEVTSGDAATEAMKALKERLGEAGDAVPDVKEIYPDLEILDGLKVNKKGQILNEDGEPIGELVEGELSDCAGKKVNDKGEVLDKDGNVIGKVKTLPQQVEEAAEDAEGVQEAVEENVEELEEGEILPPLSILEGLTVNKAGKLIDSDGNVVGELIEGDAKKLSKSGVTADAEGQFWDNKGKIIGRAKTLPKEDKEEEGAFAGLEGLIVVKDGYVEDENGNRVGVLVEGDAKKLVGRAVDEDGDVIDKKGSVVGHAERYEEPEEEVPEEEAPIDLSFLAGKIVNKQGNVIGDEGVPIARLVEGNVKEVSGKKLDENGQIWNDSGKVIGRVELIPENERETKPEGIFAGLQDLRVIADGQVADEDGNVVGTVVEGNPKRLIGLAVDEDGDIVDKYGNVKGHAEPLEEEPEQEPDDLSILENKVLNKQGFVVGDDGIPVGRLVEGNLKELAGRRCDELGQIHGDTGKVVGRCELIPENERVAKPEGAFAGFEGLKVNRDGKIEDVDGNVVGILVEGDPKRLVGHAVDEDGDIIDKYGNVKGHAEPWEEEEQPEVDLSILAGCTVNKAGNVVDANGQTVGRVSEGDVKNLIGKKVDGEGQIWDNAGNVVGRAELVQGASSGPEGPFAGFENVEVKKDGTVQTPAGDIVGRVIEGDVKKLVGYRVDEDGDISDRNGNTIGRAERWEPEEKERRINPMSGRRVNKEGEVRDEDGNVIGRLTAGDLGHCVGLEVDDNGYVVDNDGNKVGEVTLLENIAEEEETDEDRQRKEDAELADKMSAICQQTLERIQPVCKQITEVNCSKILIRERYILILIAAHREGRPHSS